MRTGSIAALSFIAFAACQPDRSIENPEGDGVVPPHPEYHVRLWVDPASTLPTAEMLEGCDAWYGSEVGCELVLDADDSDVQIYGDPSECVAVGGSITLAYAVCCGPVVFFTECFKYPDGSWDTEALVTVSAHEIGHQFGLWWHVSESCTGAPQHPSGDLVCGEAVMNPYYDRATAFPTHVDGLAFDIRDAAHSVVDAHNHHAAESGSASSRSCVYTTRP